MRTDDYQNPAPLSEPTLVSSNDDFEIVSERIVPDSVPFEKMSILYYREKVKIDVTGVSPLEFGVNLTCHGERTRDIHKVAKVSIEVKRPSTVSEVELHYRNRVNNGDFDKELRPILESNLKRMKKKTRLKRVS